MENVEVLNYATVFASVVLIISGLLRSSILDFLASLIVIGVCCMFGDWRITLAAYFCSIAAITILCAIGCGVVNRIEQKRYTKQKT